jgi:hypothetical protein
LEHHKAIFRGLRMQEGARGGGKWIPTAFGGSRRPLRAAVCPSYFEGLAVAAKPALDAGAPRASRRPRRTCRNGSMFPRRPGRARSTLPGGTARFTASRFLPSLDGRGIIDLLWTDEPMLVKSMRENRDAMVLARGVPGKHG